MDDYLKKLFIDEAKPALKRHSGGGESTLKKLLDYTKSMRYMFGLNQTITDLSDYIQYDDTENVENAEGTFSQCTNLVSIPKMNTAKITNATSMFNTCTSLKSIKMDTSSIEYLNGICINCYNLIKVDFSRFNTKSNPSVSQAFYGCKSLNTIIIREFADRYPISNNCFTDCYHFTGKVDETYNPEGLKDGYIYVPASMVDKLKSASNWSVFGDQIRALEDYTVDGTTTGELDESKVNA